MIPSERIAKRGTQNRVFLTLLALAVMASVVKDLNRLHSWAVALFPDGVSNAHVIELSDTERSCSKHVAQSQRADQSDQSDDLVRVEVNELKSLYGISDSEPAVGGEIEVTATKKLVRTDRAPVRAKALEHARAVTISYEYSSGTHGVQSSARVSGTPGRKNTAAAMSLRGSDLHIDWPRTIEFKTLNKGINVNLPAVLSTRWENSSDNGESISDLPLTVPVNSGRRRSCSNGGRDFVFKTPNGTIRVKRSS